MGSLDINFSDLRSVVTRNSLTNGSEERETRIISRAEGVDEEGNPVVGFLSGVFGNGVQFVGWIFQTVTKGLSFSVGALWSLVIQGALALYNFNWNTTDEEYDQYLTGMRNIIASQLGGTIGNALGYLVCGIVPSTLMLQINRPAALYVLRRLGTEALEEFMGNLGALVRTTANYLLQSTVIGIYKNTRKVVRTLLGNPASPAAALIGTLFGNDAREAIAGWGKVAREPWSFRLAVENAIDNIKNPFWQNFFEEMHEEFIEGCIEAGYVGGSALDEWIFQQKLQQMGELGQQRVVEITPDRSIEDETIIVAGSEQLVRTQIPQILATYRMVEDRDIGQVVGEPVFETAQRQRAEYVMRIEFRGVAKPPWLLPDGRQSKRVQITIPAVKKSKVDWEDIKRWAGGSNGYNWGRFKAIAQLENKQVLYVYGGSAAEAEDRVSDLLNLTDLDFLNMAITEEKKQGQRLIYESTYKETTKIYPAFFTIFHKQKVLNEANGKADSTGVYKNRKFRIPLWVETKPDDFSAIITELFRDGGGLFQ